MSDAQGAQNTLPPAEEKKDAINIKVKGTDGTEIYFKIKPNTVLRKVMDAYCEKMGKAPGTIRFMFDGTRVNVNMTAEQLKLENEDVIDVMPEQTGGRA